MKRGADRQITKDDNEQEPQEETNAEGGWKQASADKLAARKMVTVKRRAKPADDAAPTPGFSFGTPAAAAEQKTEGGFSFDFGAKPAEAKADEKEVAKPAAPVVNAFAALINKNEWECPACEVRNKEGATKCAACEAPKPGTEPAAAAAAPAGGFTFGVAPAAGSSAGSSTGFTFGAAPAATTGFTFGASTAGTFGSGAAGATFGSISTSGVTFGSAEPTSFEAAATFGAPTGDPTKEQFKGKKAEASGTESDTTIHKQSCKAYQLKTTEEGKPKFLECGEGEAHINTVAGEGKKQARVILRADKTHRLVLNCPLLAGVKLVLQGEKFVKFASTDKEGKPGVFLLKVKNKSESAQLLAKMEEAVATLE